MALSEEMVHKYSDMVLAKLNKTIAEVRRLFLVEDLVDSIKVRDAGHGRTFYRLLSDDHLLQRDVAVSK